METLEQRVERLERSCRRWRLAVLALIGISLAGAAQPGSRPDANFGHITAQSLTLHTKPGGAFISASCENDEAAIVLSSPASPTVIRISAAGDGAKLLLSQTTKKGFCSAAVNTDGNSGFVDLHDVNGKNKEYDTQ